MGGPSAAVKAARSRAAAPVAAETPETPAVNAAVQAALSVLSGVTSDAVAATAPAPRNVRGRKPKVTLPSVMDVAENITAAVLGNLSGPRDFSSQSKGFFASAKSSFGELRYQITCNVILIGSSPKSDKYDKSFKVTIDLPTAAAHIAQVLPGSMSATTFKSKADGFRFNGRFTVSDREKYVVTGQAVRYEAK